MQVRILGPTSVLDGGGAEIALGGRLRGALVALLAVRANQPVPLESIVEDLWSGDAPRSAMAGLHSHISTLRRALGGERLRTRGGGYELVLAADELDVSLFERELEAGRAALAADRPADAAATLRAALCRWRGAALADAAGAAWASPEIARLEELRLAALELSLEARLGCGEHAAVVADAEAAVGQHPLRERLWGVLMLALYRSGRQAEALQAASRLRTLLREELGIDPGPDVTALELAVLKQDPALVAAARPGGDVGAARPGPAVRADRPGPAIGAGRPRPGRPADTQPFVGRAPELTRLRALLRGDEEAPERLVLLAGEPGIGKSRLAAELAREAARAGAVVLTGRCDEEPLRPYQPFAEALDELVEGCEADLLTGLGPAAAELGPLVAPLRRRLPRLAAPAGGDASTQRWRLFEAVTTLLGAACSDRAGLLVLEDLHWADRGTALLLRHVARSPGAGRLLILGTYRDTDLGRGHPLASTLADLRRDDIGSVVVLGGLAPDELGELLRLRAGPADGELVDRLHRVTGGNPYFVRETMRHLEETGSAEGMQLPRGVREVVGSRLGRLAAQTGQALRVAAVAGQEFDLGVLAEVLEVGEEAALDALDEAVAARLTAETATVDRYAFTHQLVRETLLSDLSTSRRLRIHHRIGEALERRRGGARPSSAAELAYHFCEAAEAGDHARAVRYAELAGDEAMAVNAFDEAVAHYGRAVAVHEAQGVDDPGTWGRLVLARSAALASCGDPHAADEGSRAVLAVARSRQDPELLAGAALALGRISWWGSVLSATASAEVMAALRDALAAQPPGDSLARVQLLSIMASNRVAWESRESTLARARAALEMAERLDQPQARATALHGLRWATMGPEDCEGQLATSEAIVSLGELAGDPALSFTGNHTAILAHLALGDMDAVTAAQERGRQLADRLGDPVSHLFCDNLEIMRLVLRGELEEADRGAALSRERASRLDEPAARLMAISQLGMIRRLQGRLGELLPLARLTSDTFIDIFGAGMLAALLAEAGHLDEARGIFEQAAANDFTEVRPDLFCLIRLRHLAMACTLLGDQRCALLLHDLLRPYPGRQIVLGWGEGCLGTTDRLLGRLDTTLGNWDAAERHFLDAMELSRRIGSPPYVAEVACDHAEMLDLRRAPGDAAAAAGLRAEAAEIAGRLGFPVLLERATRGRVAPAG